ncbi:MFS transporter [Virgibacillus litoralis]|uniref:MFS family permease n=1 Tax=Virgibacillus litoralis TaxID=578221 RepID=A0ABS4H868_9BACI|nr:MFS transporter [Virgibacillus litoralis]MBP1947094.1 MFS family permease [Virgibacillus litoralis]
MVLNVKNRNIWDRYLIVLLTIQSVASLSYYAYVPLIPFLQEELVLNNYEIGWLTSAVFLGSSIIAIPSGIIVDKIGVKKGIFIFCFIISFDLLLFIFSSSFTFVLILLFIMGIGYGGITPSTNKGIIDKFSFYNRGTAMGIKQTGVPLGSTLGTLSLPFLASRIGWQNTLLILSIIVMVITFLNFIMYKENSGGKKDQKLKLRENLKKILQNKPLISLAAIIIFFIWTQLSVMTYLVVYINESLEKSLHFSLFCLGTLQFGGVIGRAAWGYISDRFFNRNRGAVLALIGILSGSFVITLGVINNNLSEALLLILSFLLGFSTQAWNGIFVLMMSEIVPKNQVGIASGFGLSVVYLGAIVGTPLSGWITDSTGHYGLMWLIVGIIIILTSTITYFMRFDNYLGKI